MPLLSVFPTPAFHLFTLVLDVRPDIIILGRLEIGVAKLVFDCHGVRPLDVHERQKELTDRAIKLAEVGKPKSNWELQGVIGAAVFVLGFLAGR